MGQGGRHQEENHMALCPAQLRGECPHQRSEYKNGVKSARTHLNKDDGAIPPCSWQPETRRHQLPWRNQLCTDVREHLSYTKPISPQWFVGFFFSPLISMKTKKEKMERENRQWGLRLWSKTNLTFGKGFEQLNLFRAAQNIPCRFLWITLRIRKLASETWERKMRNLFFTDIRKSELYGYSSRLESQMGIMLWEATRKEWDLAKDD